jgi:uncharacterized delta-60 repeat protein
VPARVALLAVAVFTLGWLAASARAAVPGDLDSSFGAAGTVTTDVGTNAGANGAVLQPDGKTVVAGQGNPSGKNEVAVVRYNPSGTLDQGFGGGSGLVTVPIGTNAGASAVVLQPDGKLVTAGIAVVGGRMQMAAVRLNPDGSLDASYGNGGIVTVPIGASATGFATKLQPDGKLVIAGAASVGDATVFAAARLNADGSPDKSFGSDGSTTLNLPGAAWAVALQPDGRIVLAGEAVLASGARQFAAARLNASGTLDASFGNGGVVMVPIGSTAFADALVLNPDGTLVLAGNAFTNTYKTAAVKLTPAGTLDSSFGSGGIATYVTGTIVNAAARQANGRILIAGTGRMTTVRLNPNGSLDTTFGSGGIVNISLGDRAAANAVVAQPDGKILLAGTTTIDGELRFATARLVGNLPPTASFTFTPSPVRRGQRASFDAGSSADSDGTITSYSWNFGDGVTAAGVKATHSYSRPGSYTVGLTVTDDNQLTATTTRTITVTK